MRNRKKTQKRLSAAAWGTFLLLLVSAVFFISCLGEQKSEPTAMPSEKGRATSTTAISASPAPTQPFVFDEESPDYREAMRQWVMAISKVTREIDSDFIIIPQNASPLLTDSGTVDGVPAQAFIAAIDGLGQESLCFGEGGYGTKRGEKSRAEIAERLALARTFSLSVLSIDYCRRAGQVEFSEVFNEEYGFIGFAAANIELTEIPTLEEGKTNDLDINRLSDAENFLILLNPENFAYKTDFIAALSATNYDVLIIDADFNEEGSFTKEDIDQLKVKANGAKRLVIAYLSIGEAEDYRDYWQEEWYTTPPDWMVEENRNWAGNYNVEYWNEDWQDIVLYSENSVTNRILQAGFDGVYLDIVDGYEYFESELDN